MTLTAPRASGAPTPRRAAAAGERTATRRRFLVCEPRYFDVEYAINPWMDPAQPVDRDRALRQWRTLVATYRRLGHVVEEIEPVPGLPDMVFAANGATVVGGRVYGARFRYAERADEAAAYLRRLRDAGFREVVEATFVNEGEGDLILAGGRLLAGTGFRTEIEAHAEAAEVFELPVVTLELVDPRYYHLDTALCVLADDVIAYFPPAFSPQSRRVLRELYPNAVVAGARDAEVFGLNAVSDGRNVVLPVEAVGLARQYAERGFVPVPIALSELRKAGGGPKCCTLELRT